MPQLDFDGANSKVSADKIQGQSGTTVTVPTGHKIAGTDANSITINGVNAVAVAPSTSGNVLTSTGSAWASSAAAGGAWSVKQTGGAATNVTNFDYTAVGTKDIWMRMYGLSTYINSVQNLHIRISQSSSFVTSGTGYNSAKFYNEGADAQVTNSNINQSSFITGVNNRVRYTDTKEFTLDMHIFNPGGTDRVTTMHTHTYMSDNGIGTQDVCIHSFDANTLAIDGFRLYGSSSSINYDGYIIMELN